MPSAATAPSSAPTVRWPVGGEAGSIHRLGAKVQGLDACNGWTFWHYEDEGMLRPIDDLRAVIRSDMARMN